MEYIFLAWFMVAATICAASMVGMVIGGAAHLWRRAR